MTLRHWMSLAALAVLAPVLLCAAANEGDKAPAKPHHVTPTIPLSTKLRFVIRPTLLGLVPPDDSQDFGEVLVRVVSIAGDALGLRYEIKERVQKEVPLPALPATGDSAGEAQPRPSLLPERSRRHPVQEAAPPPTKLTEATRIRRGLISAQRGAKVHRVDLPLFWDDGDWQTDGGLLWLSREAYGELKIGGSTVWEPCSTQWAQTTALDELKRLIAERTAASNKSQTEPARLEITNAAASYPCIVNGERADLPALLAQDSLGLAQCWILADENNPLVLKLTYLSQDEDVATPPAPAASTAVPDSSADGTGDGSAAGTKPPRKRLLPERRKTAQPAATPEKPLPAAISGEQDLAPGLIGAGSGFAVVEINF